MLKKPFYDYIAFVEDRLGHDRRYAIDASKIQRKLGWSPTHNFSCGMSKTISWHCEDLALLNKQRVLVTGVNGRVGQNICKVFDGSFDVVGFSSRELDVGDAGAIQKNF